SCVMSESLEAADPETAVGSLFETCAAALEAAEGLAAQARSALADHVTRNGKLDRKAMEEHQFAVHGLSWIATYVETLRETLGWARRLHDGGQFGELEQLMLQAGFGEYLAQLAGGIPMSQGEIIRPVDLWLGNEAVAAFRTEAVEALIEAGNAPDVRSRIAELIEHGADSGAFGALGLEDTFEMIRTEF